MVVPKPATAGGSTAGPPLSFHTIRSSSPCPPEWGCAQRDPAGRARERAILGGVGGQLVKAEGKRECRFRLEPQIADVEADGRCRPGTARGRSGRGTPAGPLPIAHQQGVVGGAESLETAPEHFEALVDRGCPGAAALGQDLHDGQHVLDAVRQLRGQPPLMLFSFSSVVDVGRRPDPGRDPAAGVPDGHGADQEPAILTIVPSDAGLDLVTGLLPQRLVPLPDAALAVIGVQRRLRPVPANLIRHEAAEVEPAIIDEGDGPVQVRPSRRCPARCWRDCGSAPRSPAGPARRACAG